MNNVEKRKLFAAFAILIFSFFVFLSSYNSRVVEDISSGQSRDIVLDNRGASRAVLVLHGLTATTWEVDELAYALFNKGFTVHAPLLPGHGTNVQDLEKKSWEDWYARVDNEFINLSKQYADVSVVGVSTGGALALLLAEQRNVSHVVTIGAPVVLKDTRTKYASFIRPVMPYSKREVSQEQKNQYYENIPVRSIVELNELIKVYGARLDRVTAPALLLQSLDDPTVSPASAELIYNALGSKEKEIAWFEDAGHVVIRDLAAKNESFTKIIAFLESS